MDILLLAVPLVLLVGLWFVMVRPVRQRQREAERVQQGLQVGDEVMTTAGIFGTIDWMDEETVGLRVADGVVIRYVKAAIANVTSGTGPNSEGN